MSFQFATILGLVLLGVSSIAAFSTLRGAQAKAKGMTRICQGLKR